MVPLRPHRQRSPALLIAAAHPPRSYSGLTASILVEQTVARRIRVVYVVGLDVIVSNRGDEQQYADHDPALAMTAVVTGLGFA